MESVILLFKLKYSDWFIIQCVYRSRSSGQESLNELREVLKLAPINLHIFYRIIAGDFNLKDINWTTGISTLGENHISTRFVEIIRDNFLHQHVLDYTRAREVSAPSI